jgi:hypothetical protein
MSGKASPVLDSLQVRPETGLTPALPALELSTLGNGSPGIVTPGGLTPAHSYPADSDRKDEAVEAAPKRRKKKRSKGGESASPNSPAFRRKSMSYTEQIRRKVAQATSAQIAAERLEHAGGDEKEVAKARRLSVSLMTDLSAATGADAPTSGVLGDSVALPPISPDSGKSAAEKAAADAAAAEAAASTSDAGPLRPAPFSLSGLVLRCFWRGGAAGEKYKADAAAAAAAKRGPVTFDSIIKKAMLKNSLAGVKGKKARKMFAARIIQRVVREKICLPARREAAAAMIQRNFKEFKMMMVRYKWLFLIRLDRLEHEKANQKKTDSEAKRKRRKEYGNRRSRKAMERSAADAGCWDKDLMKERMQRWSEEDESKMVALHLVHGAPEEDDDWDAYYAEYPKKQTKAVRATLNRMKMNGEINNLDRLNTLPEEVMDRLLPTWNST